LVGPAEDREAVLERRAGSNYEYGRATTGGHQHRGRARGVAERRRVCGDNRGLADDGMGRIIDSLLVADLVD
jgi:hypothetical protein